MELKTDGKLFAGALAGIVSVATTYPLDIARTRLSLMQLVGVGVAANGGPGAGTPTTMMGVVRYIYREEGGLMGLYRGMSPTTLVLISFHLNACVTIIFTHIQLNLGCCAVRCAKFHILRIHERVGG